MPEITIQRSQQPVQRRLEPILIGERDPVAVANLRRQLRIRHRLPQNRHDPLLHLPRMLDLVLAIWRGHRRRSDHEQERVRPLDRALDRLREHLTVGDPLGVQPHLPAPRRDRLGQPAHKLGVPPRIRHEHVSHQDRVWLGWNSAPRPRSAGRRGARRGEPPRASSPARLAKAKAKPSRTRAHASSPDCKPDRRRSRRMGAGCSTFRPSGAATVCRVRVATWNVNSVRQRVPRLLPWLDQRQPDVVCLQETKLADDAFEQLLGGELADRGYAVALHGEVQWNGVAILSRTGLDDIVVGVPGAPGFPRPEARAVSATCGGIRVHSVYVPNGRVPDSDHYRYKLAWLAALREMVGAGPTAAMICGDMNIAPADIDVFDPDAYVGQTHVTPPERAALSELQAAGPARCRARSLADRARVYLLGLPGRNVPSRPRHADRSGVGYRDGGRPGAGGMGRPTSPQGHRAERSCPGDRRSRRGAGRPHRTGRPPTLGSGGQAGIAQAPPIALTRDATTRRHTR